MRVGYSRVSDQQQMSTNPLEAATIELERAGAETVLVEVGSGRSDEHRPKFRQLREWILDGKVSQVICPSQDRLGRNLDLVLDFVQLCHIQKVALVDLNGRELEVHSADGRLMTTIIGALDEHRSRLYGEKVRRAMRSAREQGLPARSKLPFGYRKVRNDSGRFVAIEIDPVTGPLARQRIEWFLAGDSVMALYRRVVDKQPGHSMSHRQMAKWLASPMLTGRLTWKANHQTKNCDEVASEQTFPALVTDAEHKAIQIRLEQGKNNQGRAGRKQRILTGLGRCSACGCVLTYRYHRPDLQYLRCANRVCTQNSRSIRVDQVFSVLQYALNLHALAMVPLLARPDIDPPEVFTLEAEIAQLKAISGTEAVIEEKERQIQRLRNVDNTAPVRLLVGALRSQTFWLQEDAELNNVLHQLLDSIVVDLGEGVNTARVIAVRCRTSPAEAPLPQDQNNVLIPVTAEQIQLTLEQAGLH
ncbi:recombinase family protein [Synechococcus sp. MEDNS5]|uniref:recombinase family protein n=1 Tax=Synechococcus sp. MEDNS5 TaxID=1442554 RepID=UPI00186296B0|nr:recombinase family protein [Synechococcus sp. MEDNS5]QNJ06267.1 recombinase family protein [Synechococcus sp. MEDNS5]